VFAAASRWIPPATRSRADLTWPMAALDQRRTPAKGSEETDFPHFQQKRWSMRDSRFSVLHVFNRCGQCCGQHCYNPCKTTVFAWKTGPREGASEKEIDGLSGLRGLPGLWKIPLGVDTMTASFWHRRHVLYGKAPHCPRAPPLNLQTRRARSRRRAAQTPARRPRGHSARRRRLLLA
jgi:hypothetical protein